MDIAIYTLTSDLHDEAAVGSVTKEFLGGLGIDFDFMGSNFEEFGTHPLDLIYVRTGGTEGIFKRLLPELQKKYDKSFYLLTSGKSNSLAASMEILSYLNQQGIKGEILHGTTEYIRKRIAVLVKVSEAKEKLRGCRLGVIGKPSDWLISSHADYNILKEKLGLEMVDIPMQELLDVCNNDSAMVNGQSSMVNGQSSMVNGQSSMVNDQSIYCALKTIIKKYALQGFTLRCFDLLTTIKDTGCLALAQLNSEGYVAGCEGDIPALVTMKIVQSLTGLSGFQANPSSINPEKGEILFAHCTIPLNMVEHYELDTHFESGIGTAVRGFMAKGDVTIFKVSGDLTRSFIAEGTLISNESKPDLCRTQQVIRLSDPSLTNYFLTNPIGNHHIIVPGHLKSVLLQFES